MCADWFNKTKSPTFLLEIIKEKHTVDYCNNIDWEYFNPTKQKYDFIIFLQILPPAKELRKLNCKNIIWIPLYDGKKGWIYRILTFPTYFGLNIKTICFSKKLYNIVKMFYPSLYVQYFPKPQKKAKSLKKTTLLFWERQKEINSKIVQSLIDFNTLDNIILKEPKTFSRVKNAKIINTWQSQKAYQKTLHSCNILISPRIDEGIGLTFLEAMAQGTIIIANNETTMNEYIIDKETGYLFNYKQPKPIIINKIELEKISKNTINYMKKGYKEWSVQKDKMLSWIDS